MIKNYKCTNFTVGTSWGFLNFFLLLFLFNLCSCLILLIFCWPDAVKRISLGSTANSPEGLVASNKLSHAVSRLDITVPRVSKPCTHSTQQSYVQPYLKGYLTIISPEYKQ